MKSDHQLKSFQLNFIDTKIIHNWFLFFTEFKLVGAIGAVKKCKDSDFLHNQTTYTFQIFAEFCLKNKTSNCDI